MKKHLANMRPEFAGVAAFAVFAWWVGTDLETNAIICVATLVLTSLLRFTMGLFE